MSEEAVRPFEVIPGGRTESVQRQEARLFALSIVRDPVYRMMLMDRARTGKLAPAVETALMAYAWGKPPDRIELGRIGDAARFDSLSDDQLAERAVSAAAALRGEASPVEPTAEAVGEAEASTDHMRRLHLISSVAAQLKARG
jgi:hypothetical protein